jgi:hypothetical protein
MIILFQIWYHRCWQLYMRNFDCLQLQTDARHADRYWSPNDTSIRKMGDSVNAPIQSREDANIYSRKRLAIWL